MLLREMMGSSCRWHSLGQNLLCALLLVRQLGQVGEVLGKALLHQLHAPKELLQLLEVVRRRRRAVRL